MKNNAKQKLKEFINTQTNNSYSTKELSDMFYIGRKTCSKYLNKFLEDPSMNPYIKARTMGFSDLWIFTFPKHENKKISSLEIQ